MLWAALASHLSTNVSKYAVDALSCMVLRLPPTCLQLGPPVSARVLWVFWAAQLILHLCPPCLPLVSDCLPVCSGCSALFPYCLHGYFGCSVPHEPTLVSPLSLLLSPNKLWVLWAAGSYTCFPLVFYCLTVRCSVGALGCFLFSFVSQYAMLRDFRRSLLSGSLVHHWGGRSVPSTCFHAFHICFPSLFL